MGLPARVRNHWRRPVMSVVRLKATELFCHRETTEGPLTDVKTYSNRARASSGSGHAPVQRCHKAFATLPGSRSL